MTDEEERLRTVILMRGQGSTPAEIARRLGIHPSTVREVISCARRHALEQVRSDTVEELVAQHQVERSMRARKLARLLEQAELRNDVRAQVEVIRELRAEDREHLVWMEKIGAFDSYRLRAANHREKMPGQEGLALMQDAFRELADALSSADPIGAIEALSHDPVETAH